MGADQEREDHRAEDLFLESTLVEAWQRCAVASKGMNDLAAREIRESGFPVILKFMLDKRSKHGKA